MLTICLRLDPFTLHSIPHRVAFLRLQSSRPKHGEGREGLNVQKNYYVQKSIDRGCPVETPMNRGWWASLLPAFIKVVPSKTSLVGA